MAKIGTGKLFISVKASRYITHMKKLKDPVDSLHEFLTHASALKEKLGPVLFQLPPGWKVNTERLEGFLKVLPKQYRYDLNSVTGAGTRRRYLNYCVNIISLFVFVSWPGT